MRVLIKLITGLLSVPLFAIAAGYSAYRQQDSIDYFPSEEISPGISRLQKLPGIEQLAGEIRYLGETESTYDRLHASIKFLLSYAPCGVAVTTTLPPLNIVGVPTN